MPIEPEDEFAVMVSRLKKGGRLTHAELARVKERLRTPKPSDDLYNLARALALGAPPSEENVKLLDHLLDIGTEEWGLSGIIYALCRDWGLAEDYRDRLLQMAHPELWDSHPSAAIAAVSCIGEYLQRIEDRYAIASLLTYLESMHAVSSASKRVYLDHVWGALDQWMRGREAVVHPTKYDPTSKQYVELVNRVRALH